MAKKSTWITDDIPTTQRVIDGGITADGRWAWWTTLERYPGVEVAQGSQVLYRRRVDSDDTACCSNGNGQSDHDREPGRQLTLNVVLKSKPTADEVTVRVEVTDLTEGVATEESLTFTSLNWADPQLVFVSGQNDADSDGDVEYTVRFTPTSLDSLYNGTRRDRGPANEPRRRPAPNGACGHDAADELDGTAGESASFSVAVSGVPAPTYQWSIDGQPIQGQTSDTPSSCGTSRSSTPAATPWKFRTTAGRSD